MNLCVENWIDVKMGPRVPCFSTATPPVRITSLFLILIITNNNKKTLKTLVCTVIIVLWNR